MATFDTPRLKITWEEPRLQHGTRKSKVKVKVKAKVNKQVNFLPAWLVRLLDHPNPRHPSHAV